MRLANLPDSYLDPYFEMLTPGPRQVLFAAIVIFLPGVGSPFSSLGDRVEDQFGIPECIGKAFLIQGH